VEGVPSGAENILHIMRTRNFQARDASSILVARSADSSVDSGVEAQRESGGMPTLPPTQGPLAPLDRSERRGLLIAAIAIVLLGALVGADRADAHYTVPGGHWHLNREASWYGPGFYGRRTACGKIHSTRSWHVAALKRDIQRCGLRLVICNRGVRPTRCVRVRVMDSGAHHSGRRDLDLAPRVKRALRCGDLCTVNWRTGWPR
jgi:hypothetical protein